MATRTFDLLYIHVQVLQTLWTTTNSVIVVRFSLFAVALQGVVNLLYVYIHTWIFLSDVDLTLVADAIMFSFPTYPVCAHHNFTTAFFALIQ